MLMMMMTQNLHHTHIQRQAQNSISYSSLPFKHFLQLNVCCSPYFLYTKSKWMSSQHSLSICIFYDRKKVKIFAKIKHNKGFILIAHLGGHHVSLNIDNKKKTFITVNCVYFSTFAGLCV